VGHSIKKKPYVTGILPLTAVYIDRTHGNNNNNNNNNNNSAVFTPFSK